MLCFQKNAIYNYVLIIFPHERMFVAGLGRPPFPPLGFPVRTALGLSMGRGLSWNLAIQHLGCVYKREKCSEDSPSAISAFSCEGQLRSNLCICVEGQPKSCPYRLPLRERGWPAKSGHNRGRSGENTKSATCGIIDAQSRACHH